MTKGKVVLVRFPFDDLSGSKVRPALCLNNPVGQYHHVILAFITSQIPSNLLLGRFFLTQRAQRGRKERKVRKGN